ncbi:hypothetical protein LHK_00230 [Laribacter hongkongensis HLHK9]|uniref:Uncharacterized protein n=1 Tax=Laribacter hongkongensis (strain HLHK9) TaxID=557598 RepID=C1DAP4_LARHH|nr:hypothetical protein [Laribacter hongkongensis]ACO73225.1 hypothetical protein LHK_00230 [Laribacter hongkongensis HLHK9]
MANRQLLREIRLVHAEVNGIYGHRAFMPNFSPMASLAGGIAARA